MGGSFRNAHTPPMERSSLGSLSSGNSNSVKDLFPYLLIKEIQSPGYPPFIFMSFQVKTVTEISEPTISFH